MPQINEHMSNMTSEQLALEGLRISYSEYGINVLDKEYVSSVKKRISELFEEIEEAKLLGDIEKQEELESRVEQLATFLGANKNSKGNSRLTDDSVEKYRKKIEKCIRTDIKNMQLTFPAFAQHLSAIKKGAFCEYKPPVEIIWRI